MMRVLHVILFLLSASVVSAADPNPTSIGWRGDGSGQYPNADPPTVWGRVSKTIQGLHFQAKKPKGAGAEGTPMPDGVIREWLVLGPVPLPDGGAVNKDSLPDETQLAPDENDKAGDLTWKKLAVDNAWLDFIPALGKPAKGLAYAYTNIYSETGGAFRMNFTELNATRLILNGKPIATGGVGRYKLDLLKGWNRLLLKIAPREMDWACGVVLHAWAGAQYDNTHIAWITALPGAFPGFYGGGEGCGAPIIVKDRIYLLSEPHDLICLNKADGKVLWVRSNSYFDTATGEDKKNPAYSEAAPLAAKVAEINNSLTSAPIPQARSEEKAKLENDIYAKMKTVDEKRFKRPEMSDVGYSGFTPASDGQFVYVWFATGVSACYDLDGNRKWIRVDNIPNFEHGVSTSPILADGKLIVFLRDVIAIDAKTGATAWQNPLVPRQGANPDGYFHGTPVSFQIGGVPVIAEGNGSVIRLSDGKVLFKNPEMGKQSICSPVLDHGNLFQCNAGGNTLFIHKVPDAFNDPLALLTRKVLVDTGTFPKYYLNWHMSSPLVNAGLAYLVNNNGVLTLVDVAEARIIYQKMLDLDHFQWSNEAAARGIGSSPALAGKYLYFVGNNGTTVVLEPGRTFKQIDALL